MKRTAVVELNEDFEYVCDVTKSWVAPNGRRHIRGVASGIAEDRAGERVSSNAIAKMAATPLAGGAVKLTTGHDQDWLTEFGEVEKLDHDREHDELIYEASLPPLGEDPIADKAWRELTVNGRKLGVSIGGKLRKAFYELVDGPRGQVRKRKVLDEIGLRHLALTAKPCYPTTFAECVAKTWDAAPPADDAFTVDADPDTYDVVAKAKPDPDEDGDQDQPTEGDAPGSQDDPDGDTPPEDGQPQPAAATADATADAPTDAEDAQQLPMARHLSCPNCGHEFAAPMDETAPDRTGDDTEEDDGETRKSHPDQETPMTPLTEAVAKLRTLAEDADVAKTDAEAAAAAPETDEPVAKTDEPELDDVVKMLAASHAHHDQAIAKVTSDVTEALTIVGKAVKGLQDAVTSLPQGRKSLARVLPPNGEVEKTDAGNDDVKKRIEAAESPFEALKIANEALYGIR